MKRIGLILIADPDREVAKVLQLHHLSLLLFSRRHIDLQLFAGALCPEKLCPEKLCPENLCPGHQAQQTG